MKKFTRFLALAIAILASVNAWGRISPGERVTDYSLLKTGDRIFVEGKWGPNNADLEAGHWLSTHFPARRADSIVVAVQETVGSQAAFELEESGSTYTIKYADGTTEELKGFYVKSVKSGLWLTRGKEEGITYTCDLMLTENKATEWYISKAVTMGQNPDDPDGDRINIAPENAAFFFCLAGDGTVLRLNNNYKDATNTYFCDKVAYFNNSTVWHEITYASEEDNSLEAVLLDIDELYTLAYTLSQTLVVGTNPGFCDENYYNALDVAMANSQDDSQLTTAEAAQTCYDNLLNAYLDISEKGVIPIRDGYYWIVNCQNEWNALQEGGTQVALSAQGKEVWWNTINKDKAEYIWKIAQLPGGKYAMQNLGTQQFVDYGSGNTGVYTSADSSKNNVEFIALATAGSWGVKAYNPTPDGDDSYIHCRNHSLDPATGASACLWLPRPQEFSGWYLLSVPQDIVEKLTPKDDEVEKQKLARALVDSLNNLISDVKAMITPSLEYDKTNATSVIPTLEAAQANNFADFFSNAGMSVEHGYSYGNDGGGFTALIDNDPATHFHTTYGTQPAWSDYTDTGTGYGYPTTKHNLGCKLTQAVNNVFFVWTERTGTYHDTPVKIDLEVSNDGENWTNVSYGYNLYTLAGSGGEVSVGPFEFNDNYQYVRFATDGSARGKFFNLAGMDILTGVTYAKSCQLSAVEPATRIALFGALSNGNKQAENDSISNIENLKAAIAQLTDAYNAFVSTFVDVKDLKTAITRAKNALNGYVKSENTVGTYDTASDPDAVKSAMTEAESLIANVGYTQEEVDNAAKKIDEALAELYTHIIAPDPTKWYQIQFASEDEYTEFKFDADAEALIDRVVCVTQGQDETTKAPKPYDSAEDVIYGSAWLQSVPAENAWDVPELTYFRFIAVGDSGYVIQNKATGLFVPNLGTSVKTNLSTVPGVFTVEWFGNGFVTLNTHSLFDGTTNNNNFHFGNSSDYSQYYIVGWNSGMSTKSAFHLVTIEEEESVGSVNMTGTRALTIPESLKLEGGANAYTAKGKVVEEDGTTYIAMERVEGEVPAGMPAVIIPEDPEAAYTVRLGTDFVSTEASTVGVQGTFVSRTMPDGSALLKAAEDKSLYWQPLSTVGMSSTANGIYLDVANIGQMPDVAKDEADLLILVKDYSSTVSVDKIKTNVSGKHEIHTVDGVKLGVKPENLKKGIYIIDGKKVYVP